MNYILSILTLIAEKFGWKAVVQWASKFGVKVGAKASKQSLTQAAEQILVKIGANKKLAAILVDMSKFVGISWAVDQVMSLWGDDQAVPDTAMAQLSEDAGFMRDYEAHRAQQLDAQAQAEAGVALFSGDSDDDFDALADADGMLTAVSADIRTVGGARVVTAMLRIMSHPRPAIVRLALARLGSDPGVF